MNALEQLTALLERKHIEGGWYDEDVARDILALLGLDETGYPIQPPAPDALPEQPAQPAPA